MSTPDLHEEPEVAHDYHARRLRNGLISLAILLALIVGLLLAVPGLHGVGEVVTDMSPAWVAAAVALEILSCVSYIVVFLAVFDRVPVAFGARVALTEMAFGAAVSLGGAGSIAVGAWLLHERGMAVGEVAERSAALFLLTSAINVITLAGVGFLVGIGLLPGSTNPLLTLVPAAAAVVAFVFFFSLPRLTDRSRHAQGSGRLATLLRGTATAIRTARGMLRRPDAVIAAFGYLWFDIAVLWACFEATGHAPPIGVIVLAYQIGYLVNVLPIPGNIGVLEGSFTALLVLYHVHATTAAAASVVYHTIALWIPALWGTIAFIRLRRSHETLTPRPGDEERARLRRGRSGVG